MKGCFFFLLFLFPFFFGFLIFNSWFVLPGYHPLMQFSDGKDVKNFAKKKKGGIGRKGTDFYPRIWLMILLNYLAWRLTFALSDTEGISRLTLASVS